MDTTTGTHIMQTALHGAFIGLLSFALSAGFGWLAQWGFARWKGAPPERNVATVLKFTAMGLMLYALHQLTLYGQLFPPIVLGLIVGVAGLSGWEVGQKRFRG